MWFKYRAPHVDPADYEIFFGENYKEWMQKFDDLKKTLPAIPEHYDNIYAITWLLTYFDEGRADSMKEAMNLFEQEEIQAPMQRQRDNVGEIRDRIFKRGLRLFFPNQAN
ncbi:hypothetical protein FD02_GL001870 [Lacticaseibacillus nasuensis JCM 17158]|uniref:Uncharacterized protein n=1 Tax=Lacticaseibacillus nasuensis JCM 17158 TaxID=1291734 RepID=A0A0R1JRR8_9LACO|nr:hypothetical protein FD02_GL001870 [Lacticaseibacillus nasuensis JCM 17158]